MNRRGFLGRALLGAAAVLGMGAMKAEAAPLVAGGDDLLVQPKSGSIVLTSNAVMTNATLPPGTGLVMHGSNIRVENCTFTGVQSYGITIPAGTYRFPSTGVAWPSGTTIRGAGIDQTAIKHAPTVGAMCFDSTAQTMLVWNGRQWMRSLDYVPTV
jgi:hypothetical protein